MADVALTRDLALMAAQQWAQQHGPRHAQVDDFGKAVADVARAVLAQMAMPTVEPVSQSGAGAVRSALAQPSPGLPCSTGHELAQTEQVGA